MNKKRFETIYTQGVVESIQVIRDTETGVAYLAYQNGYGGGICPLLNSDGTVMVYKDKFETKKK